MSKKLQERNFQKRLTTDLRETGWHVTKLQSGMGYTVLDLFATSLRFGPMWVELKTLPTKGTKIGLTELQRKEMRDLQNHGCVAVCLTCIKINNVEELYLTTNYEEQHVRTNPIAHRRTGQKWDGDAIGNAIIAATAREHLRVGDDQPVPCRATKTYGKRVSGT